jgi:hypothetical protein
MKQVRLLLIAALIVVSGVTAFFLWKNRPPETVTPLEKTRPQDVDAPSTNLLTVGAPKPQLPGSLVGIKQPVSQMTASEMAAYEQTFAARLKPALEKWCRLYAGHTPFQPNDVTPDKLRERIFPGRPAQGYAFVINGTTLCIQDNRGIVYVEYIMAPGASDLMGPRSGTDALASPSVTREEIFRLLRADSGQDYPPSQVAIRPTKMSTAMNGGVFVDVGETVNLPNGNAITDFSMVFGPDGKLVYYLRGRPQTP